MDADALLDFLAAEFPQALSFGFDIEAVEHDRLLLSLPTGEVHLRPGGTVSGPTLMTLADTAAYLFLLSRLGPVALAVTTSIECHFLRKAPPGCLHATATPLKIGRRLAVVSVSLTAEGVDGPVGHATVTYAIPRTATT